MTTEAKIDEIYKLVRELNMAIAKAIVHQEQHRKELDEQKAVVSDLVALKNKGIGVAILGGTGLGAFFSWLFKHT